MKKRAVVQVLLLMQLQDVFSKSVKIDKNETLPAPENEHSVKHLNGTSDALYSESQALEDSLDKNQTGSFFDGDLYDEAPGIVEDSINRVQKVLNAFFEVTGMLADVPRQLWMLPIRFGFYPGIKVC